MKVHKGMRPQDVVVLLKIIAKGKEAWLNKDLAQELFLSPSEISESLNRSLLAGLVDPTKRKVFLSSLLDFLFFGLRYVYPVQPGAVTRGIPTAHSVPVMAAHFSAEEKYVWPDGEGEERGQAIEPLYPGVIKAVKADPKLYDLVALTEVLRVGRTREISVAKDLLNKMVKESIHVPSH
jgi:predicted transcriptional regulator